MKQVIIMTEDTPALRRLAPARGRDLQVRGVHGWAHAVVACVDLRVKSGTACSHACFQDYNANLNTLPGWFQVYVSGWFGVCT